jgi:hypothetical protein
MAQTSKDMWWQLRAEEASTSSLSLTNFRQETMDFTFTRQETCVKRIVWAYANIMIKDAIAMEQDRCLTESDIQETSEIYEREVRDDVKKHTAFRT